MQFFKFFSRKDPTKALRAERDSLLELKVEMEDRLRRAQSDIENLRDERDTARAEALRASQAVADWIAQLKFGRSIFSPNTLALAEHSESDLRPMQGRPRMREHVNRMTQEFYDQYDTAMAEQAIATVTSGAP